jgi:hypothetical protein
MADLFTALLKPVFIKGAAIAWENRKHLSVFFRTKFGSYNNKDIRFSISYLFKIQIPDTNKYLLVLNRRIENQLQPVGGVYKRYGDDSLFNKWEYKPDNKRNGLDTDKKSSSDLRFMVRGKYVIEVMNWFESMHERETDPNREFKEELLDTNILNSDVFQSLTYKHIRRYSDSLSWSKYFKCFEVKIYDVFELIPNEQQKRSLTDLAQEDLDLTRGYAIADCDEIEHLRLVVNGKQIARIGEHTKLIINKTLKE